ncbi:peptidoglycan recognition protein family protein [Hominifimenecus sp. rT4P-3]|uniref:peptidoglycan recognition protein family protein n=1 Tax=Hominifimenecus sp. rT4P-3 TaxID=3242979 RepID=UPI003DA3D92D
MAERGEKKAEQASTTRIRSAELRRQKRRKKIIRVWVNRGIAACLAILLVVGAFLGVRGIVRFLSGDDTESAYGLPDYITEKYLTVNPYSRPGQKLPGGVKGIVVHYVANPGTTAENNRNYFENLKNNGDTYASSNFIVGLDGEILACVPVDEVAYASNNRNDDTLSIECCHPDETGQFNEKTYASVVKLTAYLCSRYHLDPLKDVIRHYDVSGKACPLYFVEHEDAWGAFREDVKKAMEEMELDESGKEKKSAGEDGTVNASTTAE